MTITKEMKKDSFVEHALNAYKKKDLNDARQAAEAFCKLIVLCKFGEDDANQILKKTHPTIKNYSLDLAIDSLLFKKHNPLIHFKVKSYLQVLQTHGNLKSHDGDFYQIDMSEIEYGLFHLTKLSRFLYEEFFVEDIPEELNSHIIDYENKLHNKIITHNLDWSKIVEITNDFNNKQKYILIADKCQNNPCLSNLANINWSYIGDFDQNSHDNGLYFNMKEELSQSKDVHLLTLDDIMDYSKSSLYWDFLDGYSSRKETLFNTFRQWQKAYIYSKKIEKHVEKLYNSGISMSDIYLFVHWENLERINYLFDFLNILDNLLSEETHLIFLSLNQQVSEKIKNEMEQYENLKKYNIFSISLATFAILLKNTQKIDSSDFTVPALIDGAEAITKIRNTDFLAYKDDIKLFPYTYDTDSISCTNFYSGQKITFECLQNDCDVKRKIAFEIENTVRSRLNNRNSQLIYLLSEPSAGSTTIAYRTLWNLKDKFPCVELIDYRKNRTYEFLQKLYTETNKPLLIFADHKINEDDIKKLTVELNTQRINYVIIYVIRFIDKKELNAYSADLKKKMKKIPFNIQESLDKTENDSFYRTLSKAYPTKQPLLLKIKNSSAANTLFKYNFSIFLDDYENIDQYIRERIEKLNEYQKNRIKYLALIQYYTGLDVSIEFLTKKTNKYSLFPEELMINSLMTYKENGDTLAIELIHNIVCEKILMILSGASDVRAWKQKLVEIGSDFLTFIQDYHQNNKNNIQIKDMVDRLFIKRNITTYDSENKTVIKYYTDFIEDLNQASSSIDAREQIFTKLVDIYPNDKHYLGHLGRFYSVDRKNLEKSLEWINKAIKLCEDEGTVDSILHHMKGMAYFREIQHQKRSLDADIITIINLGKLASKCFEISRENDSQVNNEYPFISHASMLLSILEYGKNQEPDKNVHSFIKKYEQDQFIANIVDNIENLISDFEVMRTKSDDFSEINKIKSSLWELQGDVSKSLEMFNNLLIKNTHYNPVIRRNIVRLNIHKYHDNIDDIPETQVKTLVSHLKKNLDNFSLAESNSADLLLWLKLIRHSKINVNILDVLDVLTYIKAILNEESILTKVQQNLYIITLFYLVIVKFIQYDAGNNDAYTELIKYKKELKAKAMYLDGNSTPREWLSNQNNILDLKSVINWYDKRMVWQKEDKFFDDNSTKELRRCRGVIKEIQNQKTGVILYKDLNVHFTPKTDFTSSDLNKEVEFYMSFSYDEIGSWNVTKS